MSLRKRARVCSGAILAVILGGGTGLGWAQSAANEAPAQSAGPAASTAAKGLQSGATPKCCGANASSKPAAQAAKAADPNVVKCHALETHSNSQPAVSVVVFNQAIKDDHERLSDLLKDNDGGSVEIKTEDGKWHTASVARLKSCFGRGLLFFSGDTSPVQEHDDFVLRFPAKKTS
jgi:hypothetical protein